MELITFVVGCKGRLEHLQQTLPVLARFANARCVLVDYDCPQRSGAWAEHTLPGVRVVRVPNRPNWGHSEVRNLGGAVVETPWICFTDADIVFEPAFMPTLQERLEPGNYYVAENAFVGTTGTVVCATEDFQRVGGYDELIRGWGYEDSDFYGMLEVFNVRKRFFPGSLLAHLEHSNDVRARFHANKDLMKTWLSNKVYSIVKRNVATLMRSSLPAALKNYIYRWANTVSGERDSQGARQPVPPLTIQLGGYKLDDEHTMRVSRSLVFEVQDVLEAAKENAGPGL